MTRVMFVCLGNICRSPMAEFIFRDMLQKRGLEKEFYIESSATSREELGNPVYPPARKKLAEYGISCAGKTARQFSAADYDRFDYILAMEDSNVRNLRRMVDDSEGKICRLLDYSANPRNIADPWYTGDFQITYDDIVEGCEAFLAEIL